MCKHCKNSNLEKFNPAKEELEKIISSMSMVKAGLHYKVSDTAVKKKCIKYGINYKVFKK